LQQRLIAVDFLPAPAVGSALLQLARALAAGAVRPLTGSVYRLGAARFALRQMAAARHVGKVVVHAGAALARLGGGMAVISGGMGALGVQVASWLTEERCVRVLLLGRTGRGWDRSHVSSLLLSGDAVVQAVRGDVSRGCELSCALAAASYGGPAVSVTMHAGGVLRDGTLSNQNVGRASAVGAPKATGLLRLESVTCWAPLEGATLFSSISALIGAGGQANYACANAALDASAEWRRQAGGVFTSVQWGAWGAGGMAARDAAVSQRFVRLGAGLLSAEDGLAALSGFLAAKVLSAAQVAVPSTQNLLEMPSDAVGKVAVTDLFAGDLVSIQAVSSSFASDSRVVSIPISAGHLPSIAHGGKVDIWMTPSVDGVALPGPSALIIAGAVVDTVPDYVDVGMDTSVTVMVSADQVQTLVQAMRDGVIDLVAIPNSGDTP
jgi:hypothetical protein